MPAPETVTPSELVHALNRLENPSYWKRELKATYKKVGTEAASWAQRDAASGTRQQQRAAGAIKGTSTQTAARLSVRDYVRAPMALPAFWGMERRTGWYANPRYKGSDGRQAPPWVGTSWKVATRGQGPYVINASLADHQDDIVDLFAQGSAALIARAFPLGKVH